MWSKKTKLAVLGQLHSQKRALLQRTVEADRSGNVLQGDEAAEERMTASFKALFQPYDIMS